MNWEQSRAIGGHAIIALMQIDGLRVFGCVQQLHATESHAEMSELCYVVHTCEREDCRDVIWHCNDILLVLRGPVFHL